MRQLRRSFRWKRVCIPKVKIGWTHLAKLRTLQISIYVCYILKFYRKICSYVEPMMSSIHSGSEARISGYQCQQVRWYYDWLISLHFLWLWRNLCIGFTCLQIRYFVFTEPLLKPLNSKSDYTNKAFPEILPTKNN